MVSRAAVFVLIEALLVLPVSSLRKGSRPHPGGPKVYFLHIAKTAGASASHDLRKHIPKHSVLKRRECCWPSAFAEDGFKIITFVRDPLAHVYSQWNHCKNNLDGYFNPQNLPLTFKEWLEYWAKTGDRPDGADSGFGCYIPINLQARALSCIASLCQRTTAGLDTAVKHDESGNLTVHIETALQHVASGGTPSGADFVGLTEFYQESMCILHAKWRGALPDYCDCEKSAAWASFPMWQVTHSTNASTLSNVTLTEYERSLVRQLTDVDARVYKAAHDRFMAEAAEVERRFGTRILCKKATLARAGARPAFYEWDEL